MNEGARFPHRVIRASAGTGKTYALTSRYIGLLAAGEAPGNIVATTFSRKAAGEIHERILNRLASAAHDERERRALNQAIERELVEADYAALLFRFVRSTHRVRIATLDAVFIGIATAFALELQLPPGWIIGESFDESAAREDAIAAMLEGAQPQRLIDLLRLLNQGDDRASVTDRIDEAVATMHQLFLDAPLKSQWDWIERPSVPDWDRFHRLIEDVAAMELPTTRKGEPNKTWLGAREKIVSALQQRDWNELLKVGLIAKICAGAMTFGRVEIEQSVCDLLDRILAVVRSVLIGRLAGQNEATWQLLADYDRQHLDLRRRRRLLSFDEITRTLGAAGLIGFLDRIHYRLDATMHHLLLDEFQDTSLAQWRVVEPIAAELAATDPVEGRSTFVVGDTKQAIYGWRGGNAEIFRRITDALPGLGEPGELASSWRSSPVVIDLVNRVFTGLADNPALAGHRDAAEAWASDFRPHDTHKKRLAGYAELRVADEPCEQATRLVLDALARQPGVSIGVLTRSNRTVADMIFRLRREGIFASEEGGNPLTDSPAVSVMLSLLRLADHPGDTAARFHVQHAPLGPMVGLHADTDVVGLAASVRRRLLDEGYGPTVFDWARRFAGACDRRNVTRLMQLVELAYAHDARPSVRPSDFVRRVHETRVEDPSSANVRVMTIHQSKGLEFDVVVLPEMQGRLLGTSSPPALTYRPSPLDEIDRVSRYANETVRSWLMDLQVMHEQHVTARMHDGLSMLYVAITRAVHAVHMIVPPAKSIGETFAGVVRAALTDDDSAPHEGADEPVWAIGDPSWTAPAAASVTPMPVERAAPVPAAAPPRAARRRTLPRQSPSDFEGGERATIADRLRLGARGALSRGSVIHRWCELIAWLDDGLPDEATLRREARAIDPHLAPLEPLLDRWRAMLGAPEIDALLRTSAYDSSASVHVERERRFAVRDDERLLSGAIDRLVVGRVDGRVAWIDLIDYKTDVGQAEALIDRYRPQLAAYRRAAARMYGLEPSDVSAKLALLDAGRVVSV